MKQVRYLAGAAGLAPMVLGAVAGGGAHATHVTGHGKTAHPYAFWAHRGPIPEITTEHCSSWWQKWLRVVYHGTNFNAACFAQGGSEAVYLSHYDSLSTGNNKVYYTLSYQGRSITCNASHKSTRYYASDCAGLPTGGANLIRLDIY